MNEQLLIKNIAEIGKLLLKNGAEIYRVEESLERMCQSYGFQDIGVFALPTYFTMSVTFQDGTSTSLTKRTLQNRIRLFLIACRCFGFWSRLRRIRSRFN